MNPFVSWLHLSMLLHAIAFSFQSATNGVFQSIRLKDETVKNVYAIQGKITTGKT